MLSHNYESCSLSRIVSLPVQVIATVETNCALRSQISTKIIVTCCQVYRRNKYHLYTYTKVYSNQGNAIQPLDSYTNTR